MTQITVTVNDGEARTLLERVTLAVDTLPDKVIAVEMKAAKKAASGGYYGGNNYTAPTRPGSSYVRTGTYGRSFKLVHVSKGKYRLESDAQRKGRHYTPYVGGYSDGGGQALIHAGRWPLIAQAVSDAQARIKTQAEAEFNRILTATPGGL